jgi:hypothetical protein
MTTEKRIGSSLYSVGDVLDGPLMEFPQRVKEYLDRNKLLFTTKGAIEFNLDPASWILEFDGGQWGDNAEIRVYVPWIESDEAYQKRLETEAATAERMKRDETARKKKKRAEEKALYERLKKKYEGGT